MSERLNEPNLATTSDGMPAGLSRLRIPVLLIGLISLGLCLMGALVDSSQFFRSYLFAFMFFLGISLGSMAFLMIGHLTGGGWAVVSRRFCEAAALMLPLMVVLFIPLCFGLHTIYPWAMLDHPDLMNDAVIKSRGLLINPTAWIIRGFAYLIIWSVFALLLSGWSRRQDDSPTAGRLKLINKISAIGIPIYFLLVTALAVDWVLSREIHWYSSVIGFLVAVGQAGSGISFIILMVCCFAGRAPLRKYLNPQHLNDLGNLLLTCVILWAYLSLAQFLVIWQGNMTEDVGYYVHRGLGPIPNTWRYFGMMLVVFHFTVPFFLLLIRNLKRKTPSLSLLAALVLVMRMLDVLWMIAPSGPQPEPGKVFWTDIVAILGIGGVWFFVYLGILQSRPLLPGNVPHPLKEVDDAVALSMAPGGTVMAAPTP